MAGMDTRNSGWGLESSEAQLGGSTHPGNPGWKSGSGPEFWTLLSALITSGLGPHHTMHFGTVLNHVNDLHVNKVAARPSTHHDGSEMHPDMDKR